MNFKTCILLHCTEDISFANYVESNIGLSGVTEDFFKDLQEEFKNWEATTSQGKPKSLWEELAVRNLSLEILVRIHEN